MKTPDRVEFETTDHNEAEAQREIRDNNETLAHYQGELEKLRQQQLRALFDTRSRRPCLPFDALQRLVEFNLGMVISEEVMSQFRKECGHA